LISNILSNFNSACKITWAVLKGILMNINNGYHRKKRSYPVCSIGPGKAKWHDQIITAIPLVANKTIKMNDPTSFSRSSCFDPERNRMMAVVVIPKRNISMRPAEAIYNTHLPKTSGGKLLTRSAKPVNPNKEMHKFPASDKKFASEVTFLIVAFN
jgi:hypothetical protein